MYLSFVVFQLLGMYLFEVVPQEYGTRQPLAFPIKFFINKVRSKQQNELATIQLSNKVKQNNDESAKQ